MDLDGSRNLSTSTNMTSNEIAIPHESIPIVRMEGISLLAPTNGTNVNTEPTTTQFISFPILPDGSLSTIDQQNLILVKSADGNTILLDASQLTVLTDQAIPLYDGTNLFQITSEAPLETPVIFNKPLDVTLPEETIEIIQIEDNREEPAQSVSNEDEILPPDRRVR